jgi:hypothetical protein
MGRGRLGVKLRETVTVAAFDESDSSDGGEAAEDRRWGPDSEAEAELPISKALTYVDLSRALRELPVAHDEVAQRMLAEDASLDWLRAGGLRDGVVLIADGPGVTDALGMRLPQALLSDGAPAIVVLPRLLDFLRPDVEVPVFDVATQAELPPTSLGEFVSWFSRPVRGPLRNVVSLSLAGTPLEPVLCAPRVVREADLAACAWSSPTRKPAVQLYALVSPQGAYTDWHLDFGGSSVWYRIVTGTKVFMLAPPTPRNLRAHVRWSSSSRQSRVFLGSLLEDVHRVTVRAGDTLLIPGGWPHAVFTPDDSVVVGAHACVACSPQLLSLPSLLGGNFVHAANCALQCLVNRIEDHLRIKASYRYPSFKPLCWHTARWMCSRLPRSPDESSLEIRSTAFEEAGDEAGPSTESPQEPPLTSVELDELSALYTQLKAWLFGTRHDPLDIPVDLPEPRSLVIRLRMRLQAAGATIRPALSDTFDQVESGVVRRRARKATDHDTPLLPGLPDYLFDGSDDDDLDKEEEPRRAKRPKAKTTQKPAALVAPRVKRTASTSVRDRLSKKLGIKPVGRRK